MPNDKDIRLVNPNGPDFIVEVTLDSVTKGSELRIKKNNTLTPVTDIELANLLISHGQTIIARIITVAKQQVAKKEVIV